MNRVHFHLLLATVVIGLSACGSKPTLRSSDIRPLHYSTGKSGLARVEGLPLHGAAVEARFHEGA